MNPMRQKVQMMKRDDVLDSSHASLQNLYNFAMTNSVETIALSVVVPVGYAMLFGEIHNETGIIRRKIQKERVTISNLSIRDGAKVDTKIWGPDLSDKSYQRHKDYIKHNHASYCVKMYGRKHLAISTPIDVDLPIFGTPDFETNTNKFFKRFMESLERMNNREEIG